MVSIIIPIYNPGEALKRCIASVISQTYQDIKIILVNDGSSDSSADLCKDYASKDKRIVYVEQSNSGVSAARNKGISLAEGKYLTFIDSDDSVDKKYIEYMVNAAEKSQADIVIQGLKSIQEGNIRGYERFESGVYAVSQLSDYLFDKIFYYCGPYCKLFKTSVIKDNNIQFPIDMSYGEDAVFYYKYLDKCKVIELIKETCYNYNVANQGALSTKQLQPDKFWKNQHNRRGAYLELKKRFGLKPTISLTEQLCKTAGVGGMLNSIFKANITDKEISRYLSVIVEDEAFGFSNMVNLSFKQRVIHNLIKSNSIISRNLLRFIYK